MTPQELLVWRQGAAARFRMLGREEAAALDAAARGEAIESDQSSESFLRGWLEAEIISAVILTHGKHDIDDQLLEEFR